MAGMSRSKHTEAQIIAALKQVVAGRTAEDVARGTGSEQAHDLCLEGEVRGHGGERSRDRAPAGGERAAEEAGRRSKSGQGHAACCSR